jgi:hypothetical protein
MYTRWARHAHTPGNAPIWPSLRYTLDTHWIRPGYTGCASDTPRDTLGRAGGTMGAYWIHTGFTTDTRWIHCVCITGAPEARAYGTYWIRNGYTLDTHGIQRGRRRRHGDSWIQYGYMLDTSWVHAAGITHTPGNVAGITRTPGNALRWTSTVYTLDTSRIRCGYKWRELFTPRDTWEGASDTMGASRIHHGYNMDTRWIHVV